MKPTTVYTLIISHRHGQNVSVHRARQGADAALFAYVQENWVIENLKGECPQDAENAIQTYFAEVEDEYADIESVELED